MKKVSTIIFILFYLFLNMQKIYAKTDIAIIGAMDTEINYLTKYLKQTNKGLNGLTVYKGKIGKNNVVVVQSLVGKVNMALTTQYLIDKYKPEYIVNTGTAGSSNKNIEIGTIVIASDLVQFDYDLSPLGYAKGYVYMPNNIDKRNPTFFQSDKILLNSIIKFAKEKNIKYLIARIGTGDIYITDNKEKMKYKNLFNIDIMEMEGAAAAQTAIRNNIPFLVIRIISDFGNGSEYYENKIETGALNGKFIYDYLMENSVKRGIKNSLK